MIYNTDDAEVFITERSGLTADVVANAHRAHDLYLAFAGIISEEDARATYPDIDLNALRSRHEAPAEVTLDPQMSLRAVHDLIHEWIESHGGYFPTGTEGAIEREALYRILMTPYSATTIAEACSRVMRCIELLRDSDNSISWLFDSLVDEARP